MLMIAGSREMDNDVTVCDAHGNVKYVVRGINTEEAESHVMQVACGQEFFAVLYSRRSFQGETLMSADRFIRVSSTTTYGARQWLIPDSTIETICIHGDVLFAASSKSHLTWTSVLKAWTMSTQARYVPDTFTGERSPCFSIVATEHGLVSLCIAGIEVRKYPPFQRTIKIRATAIAAIGAFGSRFAYATQTGLVRVRSMLTGELLHSVRHRAFRYTLRSISVHTDMIVAAFDGRIAVWSHDLGRCLLTLNLTTSDVHTVAVAPSGNWLAAIHNSDPHPGHPRLTQVSMFRPPEVSDELLFAVDLNVSETFGISRG